jgi:hypothetical protein
VIRARSDAPNGTRGWGDPTIPIHHARAPPELSGWVCGDAQTHTQSKVRKHSAWGRLRSGGSRKNRTDRTHPVSASPWLRMENNVPPEDAETSPHCSHYLGISVLAQRTTPHQRTRRLHAGAWNVASGRRRGPWGTESERTHGRRLWRIALSISNPAGD